LIQSNFNKIHDSTEFDNNQQTLNKLACKPITIKHIGGHIRVLPLRRGIFVKAFHPKLEAIILCSKQRFNQDFYPGFLKTSYYHNII